jgi:hypothetical protein
MKPSYQTTMGKQVNIALAILLVALFALIVWQVLRQREQVYQGKPLNVWLQSLNDPPGSGPSGGELAMLYGGWNSGWSREKGDAVKEALRHMGTSAVPTLRRMVRYRETPLRLQLRALAEKQKLIKFHFKSESEIHQEAAAGCRLAEPAIKTQLIEDWIRLLEDKETTLAKDSSRSATSFDAVLEAHFCFSRACQNLAPEACGPLLQALTNGNTQLRRCVAGLLWQFPSQGKEVVPALLASMSRDADGGVRYNANMALRRLPEAGTVVPALLHEIGDPASNLRGVSILAISSFTNEAPSIVPALLSALGDKNANVREAVTNALKRLDPEAAAKAGVE